MPRNFTPGVHVIAQGAVYKCDTGNNWASTALVGLLNSKSYLKGVCVRVNWINLVTGAPVSGVQQWNTSKLTALKGLFTAVGALGRQVSINFEIKGFSGGHVVPTYARTGFGNVKWGTGCEYPYGGPGTHSGGFVLAAMFPAVVTEFLNFAKALVTELEAHRPNACEGFFLTESAVGTAEPPMTTAETTALYDGFYDILLGLRNHATRFWIGQAINGPKNYTYGAAGRLWEKCALAGLVNCPPNLWAAEDNSEYLGTSAPTTESQRKVYNHYPILVNGATASAANKVLSACQIQPAETETYSKEDADAADDGDTSRWKLINEGWLFEKGRGFGWASDGASGSGLTAMPIYRQKLGLNILFITTKTWAEGVHGGGNGVPWPDHWYPVLDAAFATYGSSLGFNTVRPLRHDLGLSGVTTPPAPTVSLTTDSGVAADSITNVTTLTVTGIVSGGTAFYSTDAVTWSTAQPTFTTDGVKTVYVRQENSSGVSSTNTSITFTRDATRPARTGTASVDATGLVLVPVTEALRSGIATPTSAFTLRYDSVVQTINTYAIGTGPFGMRLQAASPPTAGQVIDLSYAKPADSVSVQDIAANYLLSFSNISVTNAVTGSTPTQTCTVSGPANTADTTPTYNITLSGPLTGTQEVAIFRDGVEPGDPSGSGLNWAYTESTPLADGTYAITARVQDGPLLGPLSSAFNVTIDTVAPPSPVIDQPGYDTKRPKLTGDVTYTAGDTFQVTVNGTTYTYGTHANLTIAGDRWELDMASPILLDPLLSGPNAVSARITDLAGNWAEDEGGAQILVTTGRGKCKLLAKI